ncbi:MAG: anthranilate phosphoribosyltransferase [Sumerlaeia bacterium]
MTPIENALKILTDGEPLSDELIRSVAAQIMDGEAMSEQVAAFLTAMRMAGEGGREVGLFVEVMLEHATAFPDIDRSEPIVDTCGTGGDGLHTFNVSTAAALIVAAAGVRVAKHGNRSASSKCGSADVLEECGVNLEKAPADAARDLMEKNFCFLFARAYHPAMRHAGPPRAAIKIRTMFNLCGPLANPVRPTHQIVGVPRPELIEPVAQALQKLGRRGALVVCGADGMDEISMTQVTQGLHLDESGELHRWHTSPHDLGLQAVEMAALVGGDKAQNAGIMRDVLGGGGGAYADAACVNAAAALWIAGKARDIREGLVLARRVQESGKALELLKSLA